MHCSAFIFHLRLKDTIFSLSHTVSFFSFSPSSTLSLSLSPSHSFFIFSLSIGRNTHVHTHTHTQPWSTRQTYLNVVSRVKCLAQGHNVILLGIEPATF